MLKFRCNCCTIKRSGRVSQAQRMPPIKKARRKEEVFVFAIVETGGKQYKVSKGTVLRVEKLDAAVGDEVVFDRVLAVDMDVISR